MIRPLRARHRRIVVFVGIVVGILLIAALRSRSPIPQVEPPILGVSGESTELSDASNVHPARSPGDLPR